MKVTIEVEDDIIKNFLDTFIPLLRTKPKNREYAEQITDLIVQDVIKDFKNKNEK